MCAPSTSGKLGPYRPGRLGYRGAPATGHWRDCMEAQLISPLSNPSELAAGINYFFALLPDTPARAAIVGVGERFRKSHRVGGSPIGIDSLHMTLCPMGKPERLWQPL